MTRRKTPEEQGLFRYIAVVAAYRRHSESTTQREDAAADLGLDLPTFKDALDEARRMGFLAPNE